MNQEISQIRVEVKLQDRNVFSSAIVRHYLAQVEKAVFRAEMRRLNRWEYELVLEVERNPDSALTRADIRREFDAIRYRAPEFKMRTFNLDTAATGSIILSGIAVSVAYWIFDKTAGEAAKEAFKKTDSYKGMVNWFSSDMQQVAEDIARFLKKPMRHLPSSILVDNFHYDPSAIFSIDDSTARVSDANGQLTVQQTVNVKEEEIP